MANTVKREGHSRVQPSVYLMPTAQTTSKRPAIKRINQGMGILDCGFWISDCGLRIGDDKSAICKPQSAIIYASESASLVIFVKLSCRSSALTCSPVSKWSLTVNRARASTPRRDASIYRPADSISTASVL